MCAYRTKKERNEIIYEEKSFKHNIFDNLYNDFTPN